LFSQTYIPTNHKTTSGYGDVNDQRHGSIIDKVVNWNIVPFPSRISCQLLVCSSHFFSQLGRDVLSILTPGIFNPGNHSFVD